MVGWLVGWLVGWFDYVLLGSLGSDKLWLADRSLSCLFLTKYYHQAVFSSVLHTFETLSKHAFFGDF
ncbi:MAG: hypothetical protein L6V83_03945 [Christensenella sp.]|nr:MAG: hypothetical protein L6V83_03945 [Christensenella sp.]